VLQTRYDALDKGSAVPLSLNNDVVQIIKLLCLLLLLLLCLQTRYDALDKGSAVPLSLYDDVVQIAQLICLLLLLLCVADALRCTGQGISSAAVALW
jgi:hypothetical protein